MNLRFLVFTSFALFFAAAGRAENYSFKDVIARNEMFNSDGRVSIDNVNGSIVVRTWDKNEILIEAETRAKTEEELKRVDLQIELSPSRATIRVRLPKRARGFFGGGDTIRAFVHLTITVPATVSLDKASAINGPITLDGVRGFVEAATVNGNIRATNLGGDVKLSTVNGSVVVRLPDDAGVQVRGSVVNGRIVCEFPVANGAGVSGKNLAVQIGDGGASLDVRTVNGEIRIEPL